MGVNAKQKPTVAETSGIVVGGKRKFRLSPKKRLFILLAGAVVLVVAIALAVFLVVKPGKVDPKQNTVVYKQLSGQALSEQVNVYVGNKQYTQALNFLKAQKQQTHTIAQLTVQVYLSKGDDMNALATYKTIDKKYGFTYDEAERAAQLSEQAKDYKTAITYYQKAKELVLKSTLFTRGSRAQSYDANVARLQKEVQ